MFESSDNKALIILTGFDHTAFHKHHTLFASDFNGFSPFSQSAEDSYLELNTNKSSGGYPQSVDSIAGLAIVLTWSCNQGAAWVQSMMFRATGFTLSDWLHFGQHCLNIILYEHDHAKNEMGIEES